MKQLITILSLLLMVCANAQTPTDSVPIIRCWELQAEYPGGQDELFKFLGKNIKYPKLAKDCGCQGTVYIEFTVDINGVVGNVKLLKGVLCGGDVQYDGNGKVLDKKEQLPGNETSCIPAAQQMADEAIRVVKMMPKWLPGKQNGKPVKVKMTLPVNFKISH